jgi:hypothetical protein
MNLDELLSQPLPDVPDNGFTMRVIARVKAEERRRAAVIMIASVIGVSIFCLLIPLRVFTAAIGLTVFQLGTSPLVGWAAAALVLTFVIDRILTTDRGLLQF